MKNTFGRNKAAKEKMIYLCPDDFDALETADDMEYVKNVLHIDTYRNTYDINEEDIL